MPSLRSANHHLERLESPDAVGYSVPVLRQKNQRAEHESVFGRLPCGRGRSRIPADYRAPPQLDFERNGHSRRAHFYGGAGICDKRHRASPGKIRKAGAVMRERSRPSPHRQIPRNTSRPCFNRSPIPSAPSRARTHGPKAPRPPDRSGCGRFGCRNSSHGPYARRCFRFAASRRSCGLR